MTKKYGILGHLLIKLKDMNLIHNQNSFFGLFTSSGRLEDDFGLNASAISHAVHHDHFSKNAHQDISICLRDSQGFEKRLLSLPGMADKNENTSEIDSFIQYMQPVIAQTTYFASRRLEKYKVNSSEYIESFVPFDFNQKKKLEDYFSTHSLSVPLVHYIYLIIYWSVQKSLPPTFFFETYYRNQLNEFNDKIVCKYGVNSIPGRRAIMQLASTNIFAMYEIGNLYYYGNTETKKPDYNKALAYFRKSAGLSNSEQIDPVKSNPLALWLVSYMYINYHYRLDLKDIDTVYEIERLSREERIEFSIRYCKSAIQKNGCIPAINMLGIISNLLAEDQRKSYSLKEPAYYFLEAAKNDYVYSYNNLAILEFKSMLCTSGAEQQTHLDKYIEYLSLAASEHEPWASNALGLFYLTGNITHEGSTLSFHTPANREKALSYFEAATTPYTNSNSAWAYVNMMVYFPEKYVHNIPLLEQHLIYCCDLHNPAALKFLCKHIEQTPLQEMSPKGKSYLSKILHRMGIEQELQNNILEDFSNTKTV